jgi:hypothetical protein
LGDGAEVQSLCYNHIHGRKRKAEGDMIP